MNILIDETVHISRKNIRTSRISRGLMNLSPAFFSLNMGTGIVSILLYNFPYPAKWLKNLGIAIFVFNIALFVALLIGNVFRYIRWKGLFKATIVNPSASMSWGAFPMALATIINMISLACVKQWGIHWARLAIGLWWIDIIISVIINIGMLFIMITRQTHTIETMSSTLLLPIVTTVVAAANGGIVAEAISPTMPDTARSIIITSYIIWGTGVPLAFFIITIFLHRIIIHGIPNSEALPSLFLPLGPCGQGSFGIIILGKMIKTLAFENNLGININNQDKLIISNSIYAGGLITGLILWGLAFCFYILATIIILDYIWFKDQNFLNHQSFNISFTSFTFPIGVWATASHSLADELDSTFFRIIATILSVQVIFQWIYVMILTIYKLINGTIFDAKELKEFQDGIPPRRWSGYTKKQSLKP